MDLPLVDSSPLSPFSLGGSSGGAPSSQVDRDAFLRLLVTQLEHQDPLEPLQNEDFVAQLATFSSLEELENLNQSVGAMIALNEANARLTHLTQASALLGRTVRWSDPESGAEASGVVERVALVQGIPTLSVDGSEVPLSSVTEVLDGEPEESGEGA